MYEYVSDVLRAIRIDPKDVMLIRHAPKNKAFSAAHEAGFFKEYTAMQKGYPNKSEEKAAGEYLELREEKLPADLKGFTIEWGASTRSWYQHAERDKYIIESEIDTGGAQE